MQELGDSLSKYKPTTRQLIKNNPHWIELFKEGKFDEDEALSTMQNFPEIFKSAVIDDIKDAFSSKYPSLVLIRKYQEDKMTYLLLNSIILEVESYFNIQQKLNQSQRQLICRLILKKYYHLNIVDLKICFDYAVLGKYGKVYNRISPDVILGWIEEYSKERALTASDKSINESQNHKRTSLEVHPDIATQLVSFTEQLSVKKALAAELPKQISSIEEFMEYRNFSASFEILMNDNIKNSWEIEQLDIPLEMYQNEWIKVFKHWLNQGNIDLSEDLIIKKMKSLKLKSK